MNSGAKRVLLANSSLHQGGNTIIKYLLNYSELFGITRNEWK